MTTPANTATRKPSWTERYKLGVELSKELDTYCTLDEVAAEIGTTRQNAYTATVLALGTLAFRLQQHLRISREI